MKLSKFPQQNIINGEVRVNNQYHTIAGKLTLARQRFYYDSVYIGTIYFHRDSNSPLAELDINNFTIIDGKISPDMSYGEALDQIVEKLFDS